MKNKGNITDCKNKNRVRSSRHLLLRLSWVRNRSMSISLNSNLLLQPQTLDFTN